MFMARKLKTFQTFLGFFEIAVAAPSMKAALETWGSDSNLFHQGAAKDVVAATMASRVPCFCRPVPAYCFSRRPRNESRIRGVNNA
jgi:hypothetical protein